MGTLRLILMRHGEAEEGHGMPDHGRRLTVKGSADVRRVTKDLIEAKVVPTKAVSSDSIRTKDTAASAKLEFPSGIHWEFIADLYLCGLDKVQAEIQKIDVRHHTVLLLGHNPGFSTAATVLTGDNVNLRPAAAALLAVDATDWTEAAQLVGTWTLDRIFTP